MIKSFSYLLFASVLMMGCTDNGILLRSNGKNYLNTEENGLYKIGEPYQISNIWYRPEENYSYKEVGIASWYGPDFHQGVTANGETYNMHALSAAHRTLPLPSIVKVTNLDNGKSVIVRVNDRGPFVNNRIIDLSKAAAEKLDFIDSGTAKVKVEILPKESKALKQAILENGGKIVGGAPISESPSEEILTENPQPTEPVSLIPSDVAVVEDVNLEQETIYSPKKEANTVVRLEKGFYLQAGAFSQKQNAQNVQKKLSEYADVLIQDVNLDSKIIYRVRIGPFATGEEAVELMEKIEQSGYTDIRLVQEK